MPLLPSAFDASSVFLHTDDMPRTSQSLQALMNGLYPPDKYDLIFHVMINCAHVTKHRLIEIQQLYPVEKKKIGGVCVYRYNHVNLDKQIQAKNK